MTVSNDRAGYDARFKRVTDFIYDHLTPVNLMRVIFSCLSGDRKLLDGRVEDISIFRPWFASEGYGLYMAVKDGKILKPWIASHRVKSGIHPDEWHSSRPLKEPLLQ